MYVIFPTPVDLYRSSVSGQVMMRDIRLAPQADGTGALESLIIIATVVIYGFASPVLPAAAAAAVVVKIPRRLMTCEEL